MKKMILQNKDVQAFYFQGVKLGVSKVWEEKSNVFLKLCFSLYKVAGSATEASMRGSAVK